MAFAKDKGEAAFACVVLKSRTHCFQKFGNLHHLIHISVKTLLAYRIQILSTERKSNSNAVAASLLIYFVV